ncbi:TonB-dependent receptor [Candidatus Foliamicus sp.]
MYTRQTLATLILVTSGLATPTAVFAQDEGPLMEEILVTARKVGESIQEIPLSISAFTSEDIEAQGIVGIEDIANFTPGLHMSNVLANRNDPALRFRGMDNSNTVRDQQLASSFVDGIYLSGTSQWVSMNDIERVEVVKGPQSAFFGRATFGGAVNYITKTPGDEWAADVELVTGQDGRLDLEGSVEGPLVDGRLSYRLSGRVYSYDGGWDNEWPGGDKLGAQETRAVSLTLYATPSDSVSIRFRSVYTEDDDGAGVRFLQLAAENNCGPFFAPGSIPGITARNYYCGTITRAGLTGLALDTSVDLSTPGASWPKDSMGLERAVNLNSLDVSVELGDYTLNSVTGTFKDDTQDMRELLPGELLVYAEWEDTSFSQELRLNSPQDGRLRWMIGAYYLDLTYGKRRAGFGCSSTSSFFCSPFFGPRFHGASARGAFGGAFGLGELLDPDTTVTNQALFGSLNFDISEQLTLSIEVRRADEELDFGETIVQEALPGMTGAEVTLNSTFSSTTPRVILDYKLGDDTMLFLSYAEGNNPGGFNQEIVGMAPSSAQYFEETFGVGPTVPEGVLDVYEAGVKHSFANGRGFINAGAYYMEWTNQRFQTFLTNVDSNGDGVFDDNDVLGRQIDFSGAGNTDIYGTELSAAYALSECWRVQLAYNYNRTKIKKYLDAPFSQVFGFFDARDGELARNPTNSASFSLTFNMPAAWGGEWFGRLDSFYQDGTFAWVHNLARTESEVMSNLRGGWRNDRYTITAWVENVTDSDAVLAARRFTSSFATGAIGFTLTLPDPRQVGVTFQARFGQG